MGLTSNKPRRYTPDNSVTTENVWQVVTSFYITWDWIHLYLLFCMKVILGISPYMKKTCNLLSLGSLSFYTTVNSCFIQQKYLYSEKLHAHKKWYNALCCVWTWFLALQLFQFSHEPLANRHKSRLGQGSNNFCIQISYNVYICCIWSTLNSGRLNQNFSDSELIFKFTNTKMQRCHDEKADTQWTLSDLTQQIRVYYQNFSVYNKFSCHSLLHSCDSQTQIG